MADNSLNFKSETPPTELNIMTVKTITKDGVAYTSQYTTYDGLKIPFMFNSSDSTGTTATLNNICYLSIPREQLKAMLVDLLPEILSDIANKNSAEA